MSKEKLNTLIEEFPLLFANQKHRFYFRCQDGWYNIIRSALALMNHHLGRYREVEEIRDGIKADGEEIPEWIPNYFEENLEDPLNTFVINCVKEKFGGLRIYWTCPVYPFRSRGWEFCCGITSMAESLSFVTCEECGSPGEKRIIAGRVLQTLCTYHFEGAQMDTALTNIEEGIE